MLKVVVAASDGPGTVNEDIVGQCGAAVWVIDGATGVGASLLEAPSDAAWLARRADRELHAMLTADPDLPTADLLRLVMAACRDALEIERVRVAASAHEHPSAAFAMVRQIGDTIEFSTLGDCRIIYRDGDARLFGTSALAEVEARTIALASRYLAADPDLTTDMLRTLLLRQLQANRACMNRPGGYWVLGTEPDAADHLDRMIVPACEGDVFALASDGFLRLIELFAVESPEGLLAIDTEDRFRTALNVLRGLERAEKSCHRFPRVKVHDDATFAQCRVAREG